MGAPYHTSVLVEPALHFLVGPADGVYVDGTLGGGGHTERLLLTLSPGGRVIGIDRDAESMAFARARLQRFGDRVTFIRDNTSRIVQILSSVGIDRVDGV